MRKKIAAALVAGVLAGGIVTASLPTAQATDPITRLQRQVRTLQSQMNNLKNQVADLNYDVFRCTFYTTPGEVFDDGTVNYDLYYDGACI